MNNWVIYTAFRHLKSKQRERGDTSTILTIVGILSGVMTMITVIGVMNGFQGTNIDKKIEVESGHVVLEPKNSDSVFDDSLIKNYANIKANYKSSEFITAASDGRDSEIIGVRVNSVPTNIRDIDSKFSEFLSIYSGKFNLEGKNSIIIGQSLAYSRRLNIGDTISLISLKSNDNGFNPKPIEFIIKGIYASGNDENLVFISNNSALDNFVNENEFNYKFKINNRNRYLELVNQLTNITEITDNYIIKSWREYNTSYYNALKNEKDLMTLLIGLIFLVVGVNIYNSLRRSVYLRFEEISVLKTLGATSFNIRIIFIFESFVIGAIGALLGVLFGLLIANNINNIFEILEVIINKFLVFMNGDSVSFYGSQFFYINKVPVKVFLSETILVFLSAVFTSVIAAYIASKRISTIRPGEVIRNE